MCWHFTISTKNRTFFVDTLRNLRELYEFFSLQIPEEIIDSYEEEDLVDELICMCPISEGDFGDSFLTKLIFSNEYRYITFRNLDQNRLGITIKDGRDVTMKTEDLELGNLFDKIVHDVVIMNDESLEISIDL